jgi:protein-tyrosine phosphatase
MANICRSPMAEVVLRARLAEAGLAGRITVDSGGTVDWRAGEQMDSGARAALARRGYDGQAHISRQFTPDWVPGRDLVLVMDTSNLKVLWPLFGPDPRRIRLFGDAAGLRMADVPDPYGGSADDFDRVLTMLETGMPALVDQLSAVAPRSTP